jgi:hypothetical protein
MAGAGADIFAVWGYVVAHAGYGYVELNPAVVGALIGMPVESVNKSIDYFCQPDPASRNQDQSGCRLIHEYGFRYRVVSQPMYRDAFKSEGARRDYLRVKQQESRARRKQNKQGLNHDVKNVDSQTLTSTNGQQQSTDVNQAEAEAKTEKIVSNASHSHPTAEADGAIKPDPIEEIYQQYPRKVGKGDALKAIERAVERVRKGKNGSPLIPDKRKAEIYLYRRVQAYARSPEGTRPDRDFIPHPSTWFNKSHYLDDEKEWQRTGEKNGQQQEELEILRKPVARAAS